MMSDQACGPLLFVSILVLVDWRWRPADGGRHISIIPVVSILVLVDWRWRQHPVRKHIYIR